MSLSAVLLVFAKFCVSSVFLVSVVLRVFCVSCVCLSAVFLVFAELSLHTVFLVAICRVLCVGFVPYVDVSAACAIYLSSLNLLCS